MVAWRGGWEEHEALRCIDGAGVVLLMGAGALPFWRMEAFSCVGMFSGLRPSLLWSWAPWWSLCLRLRARLSSALCGSADRLAMCSHSSRRRKIGRYGIRRRSLSRGRRIIRSKSAKRSPRNFVRVVGRGRLCGASPLAMRRDFGASKLHGGNPE